MNYTRMSELIIEKLNEDSDTQVNICLNNKMTNAIELWSNMYADEAPWVNGKTVFSANLPAAISSEFARLVTLELETKISGSPMAEYMDIAYQESIKMLRRHAEYGCAKGGLVIKPYVANNEIHVQYIQADCFFPFAFDSSGKMTHCAFVDQYTAGRKIYTRLEIHILTGERLEIRNRAFVSETDAVLGSEIDVGRVPQWSGLTSRVTYSPVERLPFGYFKVPAANTIDDASPLGVSVFSRAVSLIKEADKRYSAICWEYEAKEAAVHIASSLLKYNTDSSKYEYPGGKERLYRIVEYNTGAVEKSLIDTFSPDIRDVSLFNGMDKQLRLIEFACSLAFGTLSDPQNVEKTAEEIRASKQRSYTMVSDTQMALQAALEDLVHAMGFWTALYNLAPVGTYSTAFDWDDSIIVDPDLERQQDRMDVAMGVMNLWEYRMKWYGEKENDAKARLPSQADTTDVQE